MNTKEHEVMKMRGSADVSYLGQSVDSMIWEFMKEKGTYPGNCSGPLYSESSGVWVVRYR